MKRLTIKRNSGNMIICDSSFDFQNYYQQAVDKLTLVEDIEEVIGIDLVTKDKVECSSTCYHNIDNEIRKTMIIENDRLGVWVEITFINNEGVDVKRIFLPYNEYGKTWSLDKQTLEN